MTVKTQGKAFHYVKLQSFGQHTCEVGSPAKRESWFLSALNTVGGCFRKMFQVAIKRDDSKGPHQIFKTLTSDGEEYLENIQYGVRKFPLSLSSFAFMFSCDIFYITKLNDRIVLYCASVWTPSAIAPDKQFLNYWVFLSLSDNVNQFLANYPDKIKNRQWSKNVIDSVNFSSCRLKLRTR